MGRSSIIGQSSERGWYVDMMVGGERLVIAEHLRSERQATRLSINVGRVMDQAWKHGATTH